MNVFFLAVFLCLSSFSPSVYANEEFDHPLTLSELVDIALEKNPTTKKAWWNATRAAASLGSAKSAYYPKVNMDAFANHGKTFKFINGPDTTYTILGADLYLSMLLYDFGNRHANVESAKNALLAANWQSDFAIQKVMLRVLENAYSLIHARESMEAAIISQEDGKRVLRTAKELNRTGLSPISDVYTTEAALSQLNMEVSLQKAFVDIQRGKLAASLGLSADTDIQLAPLDVINVLESSEKGVFEKQMTDCLIKAALEKRTDLFASQARMAESFSNLERAKSAYRPKVSFGASGGANQYIHDRSKGLQYEVMVNFDAPLFTGFEAMYQTRVAYADAQMSIDDMYDLQLTIALEVLTYSRTLEAAFEMLPEADSRLNNATKAYECVLERYKAGKERIAEVSNALRQLAAARISYSEVKTKWLTALANLAYATGTLAPYMEKSCDQK